MKKKIILKIKKILIKFKKIKIFIKKKINKLSKIKKIFNKIKKFNNILKIFNKLKKNKNYKILKKIEKIIKKKIFKKKNIEEFILELKNGVGGEESSIFVSELSKMYLKFFEKKKWSIKIINCKKTKFGYRNININIKGYFSYNTMKKESGVHRVQRKPITENNDKIHTSTCKVIILPIIYSNKKKLKIKKKDLKIETFKSSGSGGQHVNTTDSAIRIKHISTNIIVESQSERSQYKNKKIALKILKNKILLYKKNLYNFKINKIKKNLIKKGKRSEKIKTYNFISNTFIDHIKNIKIKNLNLIMNGELKKILK